MAATNYGGRRSVVRFSRGEKGFTLIELLVAMLITAIVIVAGVLTTKHFRNRAMLAIFLNHIRNVKEAAQRFEIDVGNFPPDVWRGIDPGLVNKYGWRAGNHSVTWDQLDLDDWRGPYMREWGRNPWGGLYDWDNYPSNYTAWGIPGGGVYLTLKPSTWGGKDGMPNDDFEKLVEDLGIDRSKQKGVVAVWMGREPTWGGVPGQ
jgi:prepilin-type N-terminal cleavage/methylation domain-containing protein